MSKTVSRCVSIILILSLILGVASRQPFAIGQSDNPVNKSAQNLVPLFSAEGDAALGTYINVTNNGGYVKLEGKTFSVMPWKHVKTTWAQSEVWIIFLASVSETNFQIMYLYLLNDTASFGLRVFDYEKGAMQTIAFTGTQTVHDSMVLTPSIAMPSITIPPKIMEKNKFSAMGSGAYITGQGGTLMMNQTEWQVYPIYNQMTKDKGGYDELWSLLTDPAGREYFSIIYLPLDDPAHIMIGHTLRLNDWYVPSWVTLDAGWTTTPFQNKVFVQTSQYNTTVKVNGYPFRSQKDGTVSVMVPKGQLTLEIPTQATEQADTRSIFNGWSDGNTENPRSFEIKQDLSIGVQYKTQFRLNLESQYGNPVGDGWYDEGANATIRVDRTVSLGIDEKANFAGWTGDIHSSDPVTSLTMNGPKQISAKWDFQYRVAFLTQGLPNSAQLEVQVNGVSGIIPPASSYSQWFENGTILQFTTPASMTLANAGYVFDHWESKTGERIDPPVTITGAATYTAVYLSKAYLPSSLSVEAKKTTMFFDGTVTLTGGIDPPHANTPVLLYYSFDGTHWDILVQVSTDEAGRFTYSWKAPMVDQVYVKATWAGDGDHLNATSASVGFSTKFFFSIEKNLVAPIVPQVQELSTQPGQSRSVSFSLQPIVFASNVGGIAASFLNPFPVLAAVVSYLVASIILGFSYIFPVLFTILYIRKLRWKKISRLGATVPLVLVWIASLAGVVAGAYLFQVMIATISLLALSATTAFLAASLAAIKLSQMVPLLSRWR